MKETQLYADMIWAYANIQKQQAAFKAEQQVIHTAVALVAYTLLLSLTGKFLMKRLSLMLT